MPAQKRPTPRKPAKRAAQPSLARRAIGLCGRGAKATGGVVARRPALSAGLGGFTILFVSVAANGLYGQHARHPNPMLATRQTLAGASERPVRSASLAPARRAPVALPPAPDMRPDPSETASIGERMDGGGTIVPQDRPTPAARPSRAPAKVEARFASLSHDELVKRIQTALTTAQVAHLDADGIAGEKTREAIRTFQALEGMKVTGKPDAAFLEHLAKVGIVK
ncbi:peptidoglycan-binding protein [Jiella sp. M17.18]|uniref:peptidoglycan-binding protein n=1 Tax=Jiella sp. M17.18 TaxID=3234247 RepID=UPI0034E02FC6